MPDARYDPMFGGKKSSAAKAHAAMMSEYGEKKGEEVFYATMNKHRTLMAGRRKKMPMHGGR